MVKHTQDKAENDAQFLGLQKSFGEKEFYDDLIDSIVNSLPGGFSDPITILENPSDSIGSNAILNERTSRIVLGGGYFTHFERPYQPINRSFWGVRGYLSLNRVPKHIGRELVIGELAILASRLSFVESPPSDILYVRIGSDVRSDEFFNGLVDIGADYVSLSAGLDTVVSRIRSARLVVSDGVIGLAIADSLGVPNVWHRDYSSRKHTFQVMDYLSGVKRPLHQYAVSIPKLRPTLEKKARVASPSLIEAQIQRLEESILDAAKLQASIGSFNVLTEPVELRSDAIEVPLSENGINSGDIVFEYVYSGDKEKQQIVVALDLVSPYCDISEIDKLPELGKSGRRDIGFYRYLNLDNGEGKSNFPISLPEGIYCQGLRILRWYDPKSEIQLRMVTATKFR